MSIRQKPRVGTWYMNLTGQLMKVWAVSFSAGQVDKIIVEYLSGHKTVMDIHDWNMLDLEFDFTKIRKTDNEQIRR